MRSLPLLIAALAVSPELAQARPRADVVIVWAPGARVTPIERAARETGAAVIDRSPPARKAADTAALIKRGIAAYDALKLADASTLLDDARAQADRTGAADVTQTELSDLFLYRGLVKLQQGDPTTAWDELVTSVTIAPARVLDPARFPPRVAADLERARDEVGKRAKYTFAVAAPTGCTVAIDGAELSSVPSAAALPGAGIPRIAGPHWTSVTCVDRAPWGVRLEITADTTITPGNAPLTPPSADEMLIQARTAGAEAYIVAEVAGIVGTARLIGADGRERDRRTVSVRDDLAPLAGAVRDLLSSAPKIHWYQTRWAWAAGAAVVAAAILVPLTVFVAGDNTAPSWTLGQPKQMPPW